MAILERTPPPKRPRPMETAAGRMSSSGNSSSSSSSSSNQHMKSAAAAHSQHPSHLPASSAEPASATRQNVPSKSNNEQSYIFPSLDALAQPVRDKNAAQQASAQRASASVSPARGPRALPQSPQRAANAGSTGRPGSATNQAHPLSPSLLRKDRAAADVSPSTERSMRIDSLHRDVPVRGDNAQAESSRTIGPRRSPMRSPADGRQRDLPSVAPSAPSAADEAFQAQIERAIASGQNPFMDRKRAQMRDESGERRDLQATERKDAAKFGADERDDDERAWTSRTTEKLALAETNEQRGQDQSSRMPEHIPGSDTGRGMGNISGMSFSGSGGLSNQPSEARAQRAWRRISANGQRDTQDESSVHPFKRHELQEGKLKRRIAELETEVKTMHALAAAARNENLEKQRTLSRKEEQLKTCKVKLQEDAVLLRSLQDDLDASKSVAQTETIPLCAALWDASRRALKLALRRDEEQRQVDISCVIARNEITYLSARNIELESRVESSGKLWQARAEELRSKLESLQATVSVLESRRADAESQHQQSQKRCEEMQREMNGLKRKASRAEDLKQERETLKRELAKVRDEVQQIRSSQGRLSRKRAPSPVSPAKGRIDVVRSPLSKKTSTTRAQKEAKQDVQPLRAISAAEKEDSEDDFAMDAAAVDDVHAELDDENYAGHVSSQAVPTPILRKKPSAANHKQIGARVESSQLEKDAKKSRPAVREPPASKRDDIAASTHSTAPALFGLSDVKAGTKKTMLGGRLARPVTSRNDSRTDKPVGRSKSKAAVAAPTKDAKRPTLLQDTAALSSEDGRRRDGDESQSFLTKTPLVSTKRSKVLNCTDSAEEQASRAAEPIDKSPTTHRGGGGGDKSVLHAEKTPIVAKRAAPAAGVNASLQPQQQQKKKRRLLKGGGTNVAGDFLSWKGDAEGALDPKLNLPFELSPIKPGGAAATAGGGALRRGGATGGGGGTLSVFGRR